jgi:hypothetical protein
MDTTRCPHCNKRMTAKPSQNSRKTTLTHEYPLMMAPTVRA